MEVFHYVANVLKTQSLFESGLNESTIHGSSAIFNMLKEICFDIDVFDCTAKYCDADKMKKVNMLLVSKEGLFCIICICT